MYTITVDVTPIIYAYAATVVVNNPLDIPLVNPRVALGSS